MIKRRIISKCYRYQTWSSKYSTNSISDEAADYYQNYFENQEDKIDIDKTCEDVSEFEQKRQSLLKFLNQENIWI